MSSASSTLRPLTYAVALFVLSGCSPKFSDEGEVPGTGGGPGSGGQIAGSGGKPEGTGGGPSGGGEATASGGQVAGSGGQTAGTGGSASGTGGGGGQGGNTDASTDAPKGNEPAPAGSCGTGTGFDLGTAGLAIDRKTCLVWERNEPARDVSACPLMIRYFDSQLCWAEATKYCAALRLDGKSDWRLPTIAELETIVIKTNSPTLDKTVFPQAVLSIYWSSEKKGEKIVAVDFSNLGMVNDHIGPDGPQAVRCVRGPIAK